MDEESERNVPFALSLGRMLPKLLIHTLDVEKVSEGTYAINLVVDNSGFFPTYTSQQAKTRVTARPIRVELELPSGVEKKLKLAT